MSRGRYRRTYRRHRSDQRRLGPILLPVFHWFSWKQLWRRFTLADWLPQDPGPRPDRDRDPATIGNVGGAGDPARMGGF